jgi:hypothetical protein
MAEKIDHVLLAKWCGELWHPELHNAFGDLHQIFFDTSQATKVSEAIANLASCVSKRFSDIARIRADCMRLAQMKCEGERTLQVREERMEVLAKNLHGACIRGAAEIQEAVTCIRKIENEISSAQQPLMAEILQICEASAKSMLDKSRLLADFGIDSSPTFSGPK